VKPVPRSQPDLKPLLSGIDDEFLIFALYHKMMDVGGRRTVIQNAFYLAWEATELINSDGFEKLVEQAPTLEEYSKAFDNIGMTQVCLVFQKVISLLPANLRMRNEENRYPDEAKLFNDVGNHYDELYQLMCEFFEASESVVEVLGHFVREHREHFIKFVGE